MSSQGKHKCLTLTKHLYVRTLLCLVGIKHDRKKIPQSIYMPLLEMPKRIGTTLF